MLAARDEGSTKYLSSTNTTLEIVAMKWETPEYNDIRFGFEVTMYINNK